MSVKHQPAITDRSLLFAMSLIVSIAIWGWNSKQVRAPATGGIPRENIFNAADPSTAPLPQEADAAEWILYVESVFDEALDSADLKQWKGPQRRQYSRASTRLMKDIEALTMEADASRNRERDMGFSAWISGLPDNVRLRRAMTLYYRPYRMCGLSSMDGDFNTTETTLRTTAIAFPDKLGRTYDWLVRSGRGEAGWLTGPMRVPGDWGTTGNALWLLAELLEEVPEAKAEIIAVATRQAELRTKPLERCRWLALKDFLQDGAPNLNHDWEAKLVSKLRGTEQERRWALAWLPNMLAEQRPWVARKFKDSKVPEAVEEAASKCVLNEDKILLCNAVETLPAPAGLAIVAEIISAGDVPLEVWRIGAQTISLQYKRAHPQNSSHPERADPAPEFATLLPAFRKALYPHLSQGLECPQMLRMLADLKDNELDAEVARHLLSPKNNQTFMQYVAVNAIWHKQLNWMKTIAAFEQMGRDNNDQYAARLARDLRRGSF